ncbi:MAG TPA: CpaF family protein, partial [Nitrospira sp.]|nr:CpaF family protein [Nitrospira sp.]
MSNPMGISITPARSDFDTLKTAIHRKLIQKVNLERLTQSDRDVVRGELAQILDSLILAEATPVTLQEKDQISQEVLDEVFGLGPLEPLLKDPSISDILVNTHRSVYIERNGLLEKTGVRFRDDAHVMAIIDRIVSEVGRRID